MTEQWRVIEEYPSYAVSSLGRVKRVVPDPKGRIRLDGMLKTTVTDKGYAQVSMWRDGVQRSVVVHQLVCKAFHGKAPTKKHIVAHGDGRRLNNSKGNLRWATYLENESDKKKHGTVACGERQGTAKLTANDVIAIRKDRRPQRQIAKEYGVTQANISFVVLRKSWAHVA